MLRPFQVAADRIAEPFRDAYAWIDGLFDARSDAERLRDGERAAAPAGRPGPARASRERPAARAAGLQGRPSPRGRLPRSRRRGHLASGGGVRAVDRRRRRPERRRSGRRRGRHRRRARRNGQQGRSRTARVTLLTDDQSAVSAIDLRDRRLRHRAAGPRPACAAATRPRAEGGRRPGGRHRRDLRLAVVAARVALPEGHPDRARDERGEDRHRPVHAGPGRAVRRSHVARGRARPGARRTRRTREHRAARRAAGLRRGRRSRWPPSPGHASSAPSPTCCSSRLWSSGSSRVDHRRRRRLRRRRALRRDDARRARDDLDPPHAGRLLGGPLRRDDRARSRLCARPSPRSRSRWRRGSAAWRCISCSASRSPLARRWSRSFPCALVAALLAVPLHRLCRALLGPTQRYERAASGGARCEQPAVRRAARPVVALPPARPWRRGALPADPGARAARRDPRRRRARRVRGPLLPALVAAGALRATRTSAAAQGNQLRTIRIEAPRGTILDRDGKPIVDNVPGTAVKLWVGDLPRSRVATTSSSGSPGC